jgi:hypothetical protein
VRWIGRLAPLTAIDEPRSHLGGQQRRRTIFATKSRRPRTLELIADQDGEPLFDEREMFNDTGDGPSFRARTMIALQ